MNVINIINLSDLTFLTSCAFESANFCTQNPFTNIIYLVNFYLNIKTLWRNNFLFEAFPDQSLKSLSLLYYLNILYTDIIITFYLSNAYFMIKQRFRKSKVAYLSHKIKARPRIIIKACLISKVHGCPLLNFISYFCMYYLFMSHHLMGLTENYGTIFYSSLYYQYLEYNMHLINVSWTKPTCVFSMQIYQFYWTLLNLLID